MRLEELGNRVGRELARVRGLDDPARVRAAPVLNYGGFVNRSFRVSTPNGAYHVKLADTAHSLERLRRSYAVAERLTAEYRAPAPRGWIRIPDTGFAGPAFEWIEGPRPAPPLAGRPRLQVVGTVARLHADDELATKLARLGAVRQSCADAYRGSYHERFVEDLAYVRASPPPFVSGKLLDWMASEVAGLAQRVDDSPAFERPASRATHGDLWADNLIVAGIRDEQGAAASADAGEIYILDWDEVGLGDPAMDWAMLFGPCRERIEPADPEALADIPLDDDERNRLSLFRRASILDWIIDPLADWVAAAAEPEHGATVRAANRAIHEQALDRYRSCWRSCGERP